MMTEPQLAAFARMDLKPGDVVVAKFKGVLSLGMPQRLADQLLAVIPAECKCLVIDDNFDLSIMAAPGEKNASLS